MTGIIEFPFYELSFAVAENWRENRAEKKRTPIRTLEIEKHGQHGKIGDVSAAS
jgi:hypothetical protein